MNGNNLRKLKYSNSAMTKQLTVLKGSSKRLASL